MDWVKWKHQWDDRILYAVATLPGPFILLLIIVKHAKMLANVRVLSQFLVNIKVKSYVK